MQSFLDVKRSYRIVLAIAAAMAAVVYSLPPARVKLSDSPTTDGTVAGILHIHTNRSDGRSSPDEIAAIAARMGLKFLVFTDHGDATREPDPPAYRSGVLCLDGVEISTTAGHYVAIGMRAAPYPLGGEPRDVVEDVRRLGGFGIAAHPDSPKRELRWVDWSLPIDAMEILNPDTQWRTYAQGPGISPKFKLLAALGTYAFRPSETIAHLFESTPQAIRTWMSLTGQRKVVGVAGVDAHAKLALWDVEPGDNSFTLPFPGYRTAFATLSAHVQPSRPLTGQAPADAAALLEGLRAGHLYMAIDARAAPASFEFSASNGQGTAVQGDELASGGALALRVRSNAPAGSKVSIFNGDQPVAERMMATDLTVRGSPGAYRVEIRLPGNDEPLWLISNPIYVRESGGSVAGPSVSSGATATRVTPDDLLYPTSAPGWSIEHDESSKADLIASSSQMIFRFTLGASAGVRPRVALAAAPHPLPPNGRLTLSMRADRPMRVSVQLRAGSGERWQRSVYVDTVDREHDVAFDDFTPVGVTATERPVLSNTPSIVLVIETTNAKAGSTGELTITRVALAR